MSCIIERQPDDKWKCAVCGFEWHKKFARTCPQYDPADPRHERFVVPAYRRERTAEEYAIVTGICYRCEHYQPEGICGLKAKGGCGACRDGAAFTKFKMSGAPCPDGRFEGTPLVEPAPTGQ